MEINFVPDVGTLVVQCLARIKDELSKSPTFELRCLLYEDLDGIRRSFLVELTNDFPQIMEVCATFIYDEIVYESYRLISGIILVVIEIIKSRINGDDAFNFKFKVNC